MMATLAAHLAECYKNEQHHLQQLLCETCAALLLRACNHPWGKAHAKKEVLSYYSVSSPALSTWASQAAVTSAPRNSDPLPRHAQNECGPVGSACPPTFPGPLSVTPPAFLWEPTEKQTPPVGLPWKRGWGLIKVPRWAAAQYWHLHLNMNFWALGVGYLIPVDWSALVTQPERLWTCLCVFSTGGFAVQTQVTGLC